MSVVVLAGTFDPIHDGHRAMIRKAFGLGCEKVRIGIMSDDYVRRVKHREPTPFFERVDAIIMDAIIKECGHESYFGFFSLDDDIGDLITNENVDYIVLSTEKDYTSWLHYVNTCREDFYGFKPIEAVYVPIVLDENGNKLSSTVIRNKK